MMNDVMVPKAPFEKVLHASLVLSEEAERQGVSINNPEFHRALDIVLAHYGWFEEDFSRALLALESEEVKKASAQRAKTAN